MTPQETKKPTGSVHAILQYPDPILKQVAKPVKKVTADIQKLMDDMVATVRFVGGVGIAAPQIGVSLRVAVLDMEGEIIYVANPQLYDFSEETIKQKEACLSVMGEQLERGRRLPFKPVSRPKTCKVDFLDYDGNQQTLECEGLLAQCIQHEVDHLDGVLYIDHLSRLNKQSVLKKIKR